jgi:hypothetical protein
MNIAVHGVDVPCPAEKVAAARLTSVELLERAVRRRRN